MNSQDKLILIGVISSAHGIKGEVIIKSFTEPAENISNLPIITNDGKKIKIEIINFSKKGLICKVENCATRNQAELLKKTALYCNRQSLPNIQDEDEFYIEDLKNLKVCNNLNQEIGVVLNVLNYGAGDIIELNLKNLEKTIFVPFTKEFCPIINKDHIIIENIDEFLKTK